MTNFNRQTHQPVNVSYPAANPINNIIFISVGGFWEIFLFGGGGFSSYYDK